MAAQAASFRVGRVRAYRRGKVWYLSYHEQGRRRQPRVGPDRHAARQSAAEINGQLEMGAPSALGFQPISIPDLRQRWLDHHEYVRRSSVETIRRYAENPFRIIEVGRMPIEDAWPIVALTEEQQERLLAACDDWQFPVMLTFLLTGVRPGELVHLLLPHDLDLNGGWLLIRNKRPLGWLVKTRCERDIPLIPELTMVLRRHIGDRISGPVFRQRRCDSGFNPPLPACG